MATGAVLILLGLAVVLRALRGNLAGQVLGQGSNGGPAGSIDEDIAAAGGGGGGDFNEEGTDELEPEGDPSGLGETIGGFRPRDALEDLLETVFE